MSRTPAAERLYALLPAIYRLRDAQQGEPLADLIGAIAHEFAALEENIEQLYDDQFIETCAEWVAPYIGELIGYRPLHGVAPRVASPRAEVANTIAYRRRKGTALMLEQLALDVTGWQAAKAVEFFKQLATTQYMKHPRLDAQATADLRDTRALIERGGPFNRVAHTIDVRRPETQAGRFNISNVGIFLWRLVPLRLSALPLTAAAGDTTGRKFRLNPLGADLQLFRRPQTEADISQLAEPVNVPDPLSVRLMALDVQAAQSSVTPPPDARLDDDYGPGESLVLFSGDSAVPVGQIRICDLRDVVDGGGNVVGWNHEATDLGDSIGIDPERGRVLLGNSSAEPLSATFHYGSIREIGGGEYARVPAVSRAALEQHVSDGDVLQPALHVVRGGGRVLIRDSLTYAETPVFEVDPETMPEASGVEVVVAAAPNARPLLLSGGEIALSIGERGRLVLDGLVIAGGALRLAFAPDTEPRELVLRDCTLVPGRSLLPDGTAAAPGAPSLIIEHPFARVTLERCITGPLQVVADAEVSLRDCIVDAGAPENVAYAADADGAPGGVLEIRDCTLVGKCSTKLLRLGSNSIFFARLAQAAETWPAPLFAERRQEGCLRFSFVPAGSVTPRRYRCVPDAASPEVEPQFASLRYGDAAYGQLRARTDASIRTGADDQGEMGVCHALYQPQREANLRIRLEEYLRFGLHAGIFYAT